MLNPRKMLRFRVGVICMRRGYVPCLRERLWHRKFQRQARSQRRLGVINKKSAGDQRNRKGRAGQKKRETDAAPLRPMLFHAVTLRFVR